MRRAAIYALGFTLAVYAALYAQTLTPGSGGSGSGSGGNSITTGTYSSLPGSATKTGDAYFFTDSIYDKAVWNSSSWDYFVGGFKATPPPSTGWSWVNQSTSTIATTNGTQVLSIPASGANSIRARVRSIPSAPYTVTMGFTWAADAAASCEAGIAMRNASGSTVSIYGVSSPANGVFANKWTNPTTFSANYSVSSQVVMPNRAFVLVRIADNSTNRIFSVSHDRGLTWTQMLSVTRTDFHTPDEIGFYVNTSNGDPAVITVFHWLEE